jgi:RHS repeat-associated protein
MHAALRKIAPLYVLLLSATVMTGQVATGAYPYGTFDSKGFDTINVGNLNVHFSVPVLNKAGRGIPFQYNLGYDSSVWYPASVNGSPSWVPTQTFGWTADSVIPFGLLTRNVTKSTFTIPLPPGSHTVCTILTNNFFYYDQLGTQHPFPNQTSTYSGGKYCVGGNSSFTSTSTDGSGYVISVSNWYNGVITTPAGAQITPATTVTGSGAIYDTNGNYVSTDGSGNFTDTAGMKVLTVAGSAPSAHTFTYKDTNGNSQTVTLSYKTYTVQTKFNCNGILEYGPLSTSLVDSISYPDGSAYHFSYEATPGVPGNVTGRIAGVELPQGDTVQYSYSGGSNGIECTDGSTAGLTRTLNADSGSAASAWAYSRTSPNGTGTSHTEVADGLGNHMAYDFVEASNQLSGVTAVYYETHRNVYQGAESGTPVVARNTCYNGAASPCTTVTFALPVSQIDTYETLDGIETHGATAKFNAYGMQTEADVYDFGSSSRGSLLRTEDWTYGSSLPGLVTANTVYGSGILAGKTLYAYDGSTPTPSSGVPQHRAPICPCGNLTGITQYASSGTSYNSSATYEDTGSLLTSTTPTGTTTYSYDSTFVYNTGATLPTPSSGVEMGTSKSFDMANTGLSLSVTDPNSQATKVTSYDLMLRPTEIQYPDGGQATWSYSPTTTTKNTYQTASVYGTTETQLDGYGRLSRTETANGQSGNSWYQTDTCYDANGNAAFASYPYQGTGFGASKICSGSGDTSTYDALGRITSIVRANGETRSYTYLGRAAKSVDENGVTRISQVDGLGRTTVVCEISSNGSMPGSGAPVSCDTDIAGTGFTTNYSYALATPTTTITQGAQTRVFQTDWLGRPTLVQEPESGTTTYSYAYNTTGLVVTRNRPKANQTSASVLTTSTTQYDALGRVVSITYSDGTPTKTFAYDQSAGANFTDLTQANLKGRLSLASVPTAMTAYSYDPVGRTSYLDECLPSGPCGTVANNRQLHYTYDLAGNLLTSTDGAGITTTYAHSQANELLSMTSSLNNTNNPPAIVSNIQNGPNGPVSYNLGNGLSNVYSYDTLGRLNGGWVCSGSTSASCTGGTQVYGFANGWIGQQLSGSSDSVLVQGSTYGYDEFNRLTSRTVNSGTGPNYSWSYDRYGNRWSQTMTGGTGSGTSSSLTVNAANNQVTGYSYDAAGNMTNDGNHSYTYDAEGHITAVDGSQTASYVYNALNQRVRVTAGSTVTECVFNAAGQRVSEWNGTTRAQLKGKYYWSGRPVAYYANGATHFEHQDWLGTERMRTGYTGSVEGSYNSQPWGDGQSGTGTDGDANHYATLDHDTESDTDHAQFRQYSNTQGRWLSPDPYSGSYDMSNPQSMNRYAYAGNSPLANADHSGLVIPPNAPEGGGGGWIPQWWMYVSLMSTYGCEVDGQDVPCSMAYDALSSGSATQCPNNQCQRVGPNGMQYFLATTNGTGAYYSYSGLGSLYYNQNAAGSAAALLYGPIGAADGGTSSEYFGTVYQDGNGLFSTNLTSVGLACSESDTECVVNIVYFSPPNTTIVADWHNHPFAGGVGQFGDPDDPDQDGDIWGPNNYPGYVSTLLGGGSGGWGVVLIGIAPAGQTSPICLLVGTHMNGLSSCP